MSAKDGRRVKVVSDEYRGYTRKQRREYTKCRKHASCRASANSIWLKR